MTTGSRPAVLQQQVQTAEEISMILTHWPMLQEQRFAEWLLRWGLGQAAAALAA